MGLLPSLTVRIKFEVLETQIVFLFIIIIANYMVLLGKHYCTDLLTRLFVKIFHWPRDTLSLHQHNSISDYQYCT